MATVPGYAMRRNGSCLSTETDCGETSTPFHACCPGNMFCPGPQLNVVCCGSNAQCSQKIDDNCANSRANLYSTSSNLTTDAFCCAQDKYAFAFEDGGAGCADQLSDLVVTGNILPTLFPNPGLFPNDLIKYSHTHTQFNTFLLYNLVYFYQFCHFIFKSHEYE
ncbi:unnamed protein product [Penicillium bialowiezense]